MPFSVRNVFTANQTITAQALNQNFDDVEDKINSQIGPADLTNPYGIYALTWSSDSVATGAGGISAVTFARFRIPVASIPVAVNAHMRTVGGVTDVNVYNDTQNDVSLLSGDITLNTSGTLVAGTVLPRTIDAADTVAISLSNGGNFTLVDTVVTIVLKALHQT